MFDSKIVPPQPGGERGTKNGGRVPYVIADCGNAGHQLVDCMVEQNGASIVSLHLHAKQLRCYVMSVCQRPSLAT